MPLNLPDKLPAIESLAEKKEVTEFVILQLPAPRNRTSVRCASLLLNFECLWVNITWTDILGAFLLSKNTPLQVEISFIKVMYKHQKIMPSNTCRHSILTLKNMRWRRSRTVHIYNRGAPVGTIGFRRGDFTGMKNIMEINSIGGVRRVWSTTVQVQAPPAQRKRWKKHPHSHCGLRVGRRKTPIAVRHAVFVFKALSS